MSPGVIALISAGALGLLASMAALAIGRHTPGRILLLTLVAALGLFLTGLPPLLPAQMWWLWPLLTLLVIAAVVRTCLRSLDIPLRPPHRS